MTPTEIPAHPAPFADEILHLIGEAIADLPGERVTVLDPFAGIGRIHELANERIVTRGVELMPKWAAAHEHTILGDATHLPEMWTGRWDAVATSPAYGNRMADHHEASDVCKLCRGDGYVGAFERCPRCKGSGLSHRRSYRHYYGEGFFDADNNAGAMQWGDEYRKLHRAAWAEVHRVLRPGGRFILNVKDHVRDHKRVRVSRWHHETALALGFVDLWRWDIPRDGYGMGSNREARVPTEQVYVMERAA